MFERETGPLELADPDAMRRLAPRPSFTGIVADGLSDTPGIRAALDGSSAGVIDNPSTDLDGTYAGTMGVAQEIVANDITTAPPSPVPALLTTGDGADQIRTSVKQYLPPPETPVAATFVEPPTPPPGSGIGDGAGGTGRDDTHQA